MQPIKLILPIESVAYPLTGIGRYTYELAQGLIGHPSVSEVCLLRHFQFVDKKKLDSLAAQGGSSLARTSPTKAAYLGQLRRYMRFAAPSLRFLRCISHRDHIFHSPNYALPAFSGRSISTVHDLSVFRYPEFHPVDRVIHMRHIFPSILRRADLLLTDSEFSKQEILEVFNVSEDRVISVPLGVDVRYRPMSPADLSPALERLCLGYRRYSLSVGTIEPRKNVERLIQIYRQLPFSLRNEYPLVLAGNEGWNSDSIHQEIMAAQAEGWLIYLSYVAESDLPALYAGARAFACLSLYEGFGLPVLEAMSAGVPVVCSRATSLPEVGGEAVLYVDPLEPDEIRQALIDLLEDDALSDRYRQAGLERASEFTWGRTVEGTVAAYRRLV